MTQTKEWADFLRTVAQNECMIDQHMLPSGETMERIAYYLESEAKRDTEYQALQDIGKSAAESIAEMVAALECDYARLEELRGERETAVDADKEARACLLAFGYASSEESRELGAVLTSEAADAAAALAEWTSEYAEELAELEKAAGECESRDDAEQRICESPLSCEYRPGWAAVGETMPAEEFLILLSTGGPATRIIGELSNGEPTRARLQAQDWFKPWTDYTGDAVSEDDLLTYCRCFYFGE